MRYAFIAQNRLVFAVRAMCRTLLVHPSGFCAWLREPLSQRALEDESQTVLLKQAWDDRGEVYGYRKLHDDLCDMGEDISPNRAWHLARLAGIRAQIGYKKKPGSYGGSPAIGADNTLNREFDVDAPDQFRVTDITYIRTHEGFLYLAVVIDLFSRRVIGWSMQGRTHADRLLQALLMAVWRRKPKTKVHVHSDQGSQFTGYQWHEFLEQHNQVPSMSRRGNCWDNAVAESFFNLLKRERIRRRKYKTREEARQDVFDYIEFFYNPQREHVRNGMLSPTTFEHQQKLKLQGFQETRGYSIRAKPHKTTIPDKKLPFPLDRVNRQFRVPAPNMLWVCDFTYVGTWKGFV